MTDAVELLRSIATSSSALFGSQYFNALTEHLVTALGMDYALVGELGSEGSGTVRVLGASMNGRTADTFTYRLDGTPCQQIVSRSPCVYPCDVQKLFPDDCHLADLEAQCYAGAPLFGSSGLPLGLVAVMGRKPLEDRETVEMVLQAVSARTATEIERQQLQRQLDESHRTLSTLMANLPGMVYRCAHDEEWTMLFASEGCRDLTGYDPADFTLRKISYQQLVHPDDLEPLSRTIEEAIARRQPFAVVYRILTAQGEVRWVWEQARGVYRADGTLQALEGFITDVTERKRSEEIAARLGRVLDSSSNEIYVFDAATLRFVQVNEGARRNLGYTMEELSARTPLDLEPDYTQESFANLIAPLRRGETRALTFETVHRRKDGTLYPVEVRLQLSLTEEPPVFVAIVNDITERVKAREQLQFLALHDALTSLPNRAMFLERLGHALTRAPWTARPLAVLFLDLDRFKNINDTLGHNVGDSTLQVAAQRLARCVRDRDTVARLGGDEFTVLLEDLATTDDVLAIARKILAALAAPFEVNGRDLAVTTSIGISLYPTDGEDALTLLRNADTAMYRAKELGRNKVQFYSSELGARALERFTLESSLRHALERNEFLLYYQPQWRMDTGTVAGVEALLRWRHPELGLVPPAHFIPVAEETGMMRLIDRWVLRAACAQARAWREAGLPPLSMAVNLSSSSFSEPGLVEIVSLALAGSSLPPEHLELEITENVVMHNAEATVALLEELSALGVRFALDDFGTGTSSLSYLKRFPIDTLKIDQSFVRDVETEPENASLVEAIIAMGHALHLDVIAEGVETQGQLAFLRERGCDAVQGYLFSRPLPADEITAVLQSGAIPPFAPGEAALPQ